VRARRSNRMSLLLLLYIYIYIYIYIICFYKIFYYKQVRRWRGQGRASKEWPSMKSSWTGFKIGLQGILRRGHEKYGGNGRSDSFSLIY
jgi:hypothetical protein